jgi:hypothetical protein
MNFGTFHKIPVPGDGACFFHSLTTIMDIEKNPTEENLKYLMKNNISDIDEKSMKLRRSCINWLKKNYKTYTINTNGLHLEGEIEEEISQELRSADNNDRDPKYSTINEYFKYMMDETTYAGQIEIYAMAEILKRNIRVYIHNKGKLSNVGLGYELNPKLKNDIYIYHNLGKTKSEGSHHFESLIPKDIIQKSANIVSKGDKVRRRTKRKALRKITRRNVTRRNTRRNVTRRNTRRNVTRRNTRRNVTRRNTRRNVTRRNTRRNVTRRNTRRNVTRRNTRRIPKR